MLIVKFEGGLGNQLFQYAFLEYLKLNNQEVYADISDYKYHEHHYGYEIEKVFGCDIKKADKKQIHTLAIEHNNLAIKTLEKVLRIQIYKKNEFNELDRIGVVNAGPILRDIYFSGYWQNVYYVNMTQTVLRDKLTFKESVQGKNLECYEHFKGVNTVSVHIRRKDYLHNVNLGGICQKHYYDEAINYMKEKLTDPVFFFFSDDIDWCKSEFGETPENYYVDWNIGKDSFRDMQLMSLCKNNIIANSSFSWWGAWLNSNIKKIVIMPKQWTKFWDSTTMSPGWLRM